MHWKKEHDKALLFAVLKYPTKIHTKKKKEQEILLIKLDTVTPDGTKSQLMLT